MVDEQIGWRLPIRTPPQPGAFNLAPKAVKAWVENLPMANLGKAAKLVYEILREVNTQDIKIKERFRFLETLRPTVRDINESMEHHFLGQAFPLPKKGRTVAELVRSFHTEMALGYKFIVEDLYHKKGIYSFLNHQVQITAVHRAIRHLSHVILNAYQIYAPYPENSWRDLHYLYYCAELHKLKEKVVTDEDYIQVKSTSIADAYKQILLLSLSSPYHLRQGDVTDVFYALEEWAPHCKLTSIHNSQRPQGLFAVIPDSDNQPNYLGMDKNQSQIKGMGWILDTTGLSDLLRNQVARNTTSEFILSGAQGEDALHRLHPHLLRRLMLAWGIMTKRNSRRVHKKGKMQLVLGLSNAHYFMGGNKNITPNTANDTTENNKNEQEEETNIIYADIASWVSASRQAARREIHFCELLDTAEGGYRLCWSKSGQARAQIGEIMGIRSENTSKKNEPWQLGVIRWMRMRDDSVLEVGVQLLAQSAEAAIVQVCNAKGERGDALECVMLAAQGYAKPRGSLILPAYLKNFTPLMVLIHQGEENHIRLTRSLEGTGSFVHFEFSTVELAEKQQPSQDRRKQDDHFGDIWSEL